MSPDDAPDATPDPYVGELVDFRATARRIRRSALIIGGLVLVSWLVSGLIRGSLDVGDLPEWGLVGVVVMFVVEVVVVGGSALRGMLRAGERGERLSSDDVALVPPQLRRKR